MNKCIVLMFHEVRDQEWFETTLKHLTKKFRFVSYRELKDNIINAHMNNGIAHITFDDGHNSFYKNAFPVLRRLGVSSTLFVSPQVINHEQNYWFQRVRHIQSKDFQSYVADRSASFFKTNINSFMNIAILKSLPHRIVIEMINDYEMIHQIDTQAYMNISRNQLLEISQSGLVEVGAHTMNHPILTNESDEDSAREIIDSISCLSNLIGKPVRAFAYPNGQPIMDFGKREMSVLRENGVELAFSTESNSIYGDVDLMSIPRIGVTKGSPLYVTHKIQFAKQWKHIKKIIFGKNESTERHRLAQVRNSLR